MMGMGQQMPMRRPPTGPSQFTAGRPNPMAGFQGGGGAQRVAPNFGGFQGTPPWMGGGFQGPIQAQPMPGYQGPAPGAGMEPPPWALNPQVMMPGGAGGQGIRPPFPGAASRGIMGGMGGGPQMPQRQPPMPPWAQMGGGRWL